MPDPTARPSPARSLLHRLGGGAGELPVEGRLAPFEAATGRLGSEPLTPASLRGRVVLVDFWTSTCVNWLRTLPYQLIRRAGHIGAATFEIEFEEAGAAAYCFALG
jgi:hypothetical protein